MKQALEALESDPVSHVGLVYRKQAITILRQALKTEQESICAHGVKKTKCIFCHPEQEPVAHIDHRIHGWPDCFVIRADPPHTSPLYTSLPKHEWVGLTDEDMEALFLNEDGVRFARYIEAKLREKNT
jgi:hypothetical protein